MVIYKCMCVVGRWHSSTDADKFQVSRPTDSSRPQRATVLRRPTVRWPGQGKPTCSLSNKSTNLILHNNNTFVECHGAVASVVAVISFCCLFFCLNIFDIGDEQTGKTRTVAALPLLLLSYTKSSRVHNYILYTGIKCEQSSMFRCCGPFDLEFAAAHSSWSSTGLHHV